MPGLQNDHDAVARRFKELGVERHLLPDNLNEFFGMFSSERQNVIKACDIVRHSPLIGPKIPVHGLLLDIETGKLDWVVNGYQALDTLASRLHEPISPAGATPDLMKSLSPFHLGEMKFPEGKIGELATKAEDWLSKQAGKIGTPARKPFATLRRLPNRWREPPNRSLNMPKNTGRSRQLPPKIPIPPPIRPVKRR